MSSLDELYPGIENMVSGKAQGGNSGIWLFELSDGKLVRRSLVTDEFAESYIEQDFGVSTMRNRTS